MNCAGFPGKRILTGDRPTGRLHLGHWTGSLQNRVLLQDLFDCFFLVADLHSLTTHVERTETIREHVRELVLDYLAVGIDPDKSVIYLQSMIPEAAELAVILGMLVGVPRLQRVPALKDIIGRHRLASVSLGLLAYPVLQAADILMVRADLVPVGADQESHIEVARELARRFNRLYRPILPVPEALVGEGGLLPGIDGTAKMSKSLDNAIFLADDAATVAAKVGRMFTDPTRIHADDPGHVEGNPVFTYLDAFDADKGEVADLKDRYRQGRVGDVAIKRRLAAVLNRFLDPIRERRAAFAGRTGLVEDILRAGSVIAREEAILTLQLVKAAMGLDFLSG